MSENYVSDRTALKARRRNFDIIMDKSEEKKKCQKTKEKSRIQNIITSEDEEESVEESGTRSSAVRPEKAPKKKKSVRMVGKLTWSTAGRGAPG